MEEEVFEFLKSGSITKTFNYGDKSKVILNKIRYNDKLDIIYALDSYDGNVFDLHSPFKYSGIYDKENDKLYDVEYSLRYHILNWDYSNEKYISAGNLFNLINKEMNKKIDELIKDVKKEMYDINEVEIGDEIGEKDIITEFMNGITSETLEDSHKQFSTDKPQDLLDYLTDKETFIEEEARWFIVENTTSFLRDLAIADKKREVLREIENNKNHPYHKIKNIVNAVKNNNCVTVTLTINRNGIEQTLKYNANTLINGYNSYYLSTYSIERYDDRKLFEETFGYGEDLHYEDIIKITYGKKTIYEDENVKEKAEEICL